jgi:hypothetical protein
MWLIRRVLSLASIFALSAFLVYLSRFWIFDLWGREGLFGVRILSPRGDILGTQLRGTALAPFALLLWAIGVFVLMTVIQGIVDKFRIHSNGLP